MEIAIVGAGVSGLSCGIRLLELGHAVTIFAERRTPDTTSDRAAAVFSPFRSDASARVRAWTRASLAKFEELARTEPESGVSMGVLREFFLAPPRSVRTPSLPVTPWWADDVQGFQRLHPLLPAHRDAFVAVVPRMDMTRYMPWLERRFETVLGGTFVQTRLLALDEPFDEGFELVVNTSGLGARRLAHDDAMFPLRGQVLHVPNDVKLTECVAQEGRDEELAYSIPFEDHVVVGGTCEPDEWIEETCEASLVALLERTRALLARNGLADPGKLGRRRIRALVGLRPGRHDPAAHATNGRVDAVDALGAVEGDRGDHAMDSCVRLEREEVAPGRPIVHDYGHGGSGVTLSWGCADEVAALCEGFRSAESARARRAE